MVQTAIVLAYRDVLYVQKFNRAYSDNSMEIRARQLLIWKHVFWCIYHNVIYPMLVTPLIYCLFVESTITYMPTSVNRIAGHILIQLDIIHLYEKIA